MSRSFRTSLFYPFHYIFILYSKYIFSSLADFMKPNSSLFYFYLSQFKLVLMLLVLNFLMMVLFLRKKNCRLSGQLRWYLQQRSNLLLLNNEEAMLDGMLCSRTYLVKHLKQRENVAKDRKLKAKLPIKSKGSGQQLLLFIS